MNGVTVSTRLDTTSKEKLVQRIATVMSWRRAQLQFPLGKDEFESVVEAMYGTEVRALQLRLAELAPSAILWRNRVKMTIGHKQLDLPHATHERGTPVIETGYAQPGPTLPLDAPHYETLVAWMHMAADIDRELSNAFAIVDGMVKELGTYGQVLRMWPGVAEWLPDRGKLSASANQTRRSALPAKFKVHLLSESRTRVARELRVWEMKAELEHIDMLLATCLMVRDAHGAATDAAFHPAAWV